MTFVFNYIIFRVFEYFSRKNKAFSFANTINFITLFQFSLLVPLFLFLNIFVEIDLKMFFGTLDNRLKYLIGIPLVLLIIFINSFYIRKKLKGDYLEKLQQRFHKDKYTVNIWVILLAPILFVFICPILFGAFNGTISFPFLEK